MPETDVARCTFHVRTPSPEPGEYRYRQVHLNGWHGDGALLTRMPPTVGDLIDLWDRSDSGPRGVFRVIERCWAYAMYGSLNWPLGNSAPTCGPILTIVVEEATGPFGDEYHDPTEYDEEDGADGE